MPPKVVIEKRVLPGLSDDRMLQRIATVYIGNNEEYRVYAPAKATGNSLDWLDSSRVYTPTDRGENVANDHDRRVIINAVRDTLQQSSCTEGTVPKSDGVYYHARFHLQGSDSVELRFDLTRSNLEKRVLEPYREMRPIVISGRTILIQELERIEVYESSKPSSEFAPFTTELAKHSSADWFFSEPGIRNITDEFIQTPNVDVLPQKTDAIELLCSRFHEVTKQLRKRRESRKTLDVIDEYDVQDLLHALLRIFFNDVRPEEWTPSYGGKSARMDFLLPSKQTVVEAKKTREGLATKEIGDELIVDIARYKTHPSCKKLICFVYDPDSRISNPRGIEADLSQKQEELDVKVIIEPEG